MSPFWHKADVLDRLPNVRYREISRRARGAGRMSDCDPQRTFSRVSDGSSCLRPEQCLVERFDGPVAFADGFLQGRNIDDLYVAP